jgi:Ca-activated chloride channel family protein
VTVPLLVDDGHGGPVSGLTPSDLSILDNTKPPQSVVALQAAKEMPLRIGLLIDTSNSQAKSDLYQPGVRAALNFLDQVLSGPDDKAFIVNASSDVRATDFLNRDRLVKLKVDTTPGGGTALYDAIYFSCRERMKPDTAQPARRVLVLLSDGEDNLSHVRRVDTIAAAQDTGTLIFSVSTEGGQSQYFSRMQGDTVLKQFATETGGQAFFVWNAKDMPKVFAKIKGEIDGMYSVTYIPAEFGQPGQFRPLELKIRSDKKWKAHGPKGYHVPVPAQ